MGWWTYAYDSLGRMTNQTDAKGQFIRLYYGDALGRLTHKHVYNASSTLVAASTNYYDSSGDTNYTVFKGQLYATEDSEGWEKFGYDARGRVIKRTRYLAKNSTSYTTETVYDDADRVREVKYPGTTVVRIAYSYDNAGTLTNVASLAGTGPAETFYESGTFTALGQPLTFKRASGNLSTENGYFDNSKRQYYTMSWRTSTPWAISQIHIYAYDKVSNLKRIYDWGGSGPASPEMSNITYDDFHRLTYLTNPHHGAKSYAYDAYGNIRTNSEAGTGQYAYTNTAPYDANGNMVTRGSQTLDYDAENRLVAVTNAGGVVTFGYADDGARLWRQAMNGSLTVWIDGLFEERGGKQLCHVFADGKRIATFEPVSGGAAIMGKRPWLAASVLRGVAKCDLCPHRPSLRV